MPGLVDSTTGLMFGSGLQWQPPIGGPGLDIKVTEDSEHLFGVGTLSTATRQILAVSVVFAGSGALITAPGIRTKITASLKGSGTLSATAS